VGCLSSGFDDDQIKYHSHLDDSETGEAE
jgi:hypothetical protein